MLELSMLKLKDLKLWTFEAWKDRFTFNRCYLDPETTPSSTEFKKEIKRFGDLRKKTTWAAAYSSLYAQSSIEGCSYAFNIILCDYNFADERWEHPFRHLMIDKLLEIPQALGLIKMGFEQLIGQTLSTEERNVANEFLHLVGESETGATAGIAARFVPAIAGSN